MKRYSYYLCALLFLFAACEKKIELVGGDLSAFQVTLEKNIYRVGEEVEFKLSGTPGIITCYPGDLYRDYTYKDGRIVEFPNILLSFDSHVSGGTQANHLSVLVSNDFNGDYNSIASIMAANWADVTNRFDYAVRNEFLPSGAVDIKEFAVEGKPLYVALRYTVRTQAAAGSVRRWWINNFQLRSNTSVGPFPFAAMNTAGFRLANSLNEENNADNTVIPRTTVSATLLALYGNAAAPGNDPAYDIWAITAPFDVNSRDVGPDRPVSVKGYLMPKVESFRHTYTEPGTYTAYFIAANKDVNESQETVRSIEVTIVP